jgi:long-chain acyl-CoA synthetase
MVEQQTATIRPWLAHYPQGVPARIDEASPETIVDILRHAAQAYPDRPAVESFGVRLTYAELIKRAEEIAIGLQRFGLQKGDRVAIMMPNVMAYPAVLFGILLGGYTVVNINPLYTARELTHQVNDSGARVLFVLENFAHTVQEALADLTAEMAIVVSPGDLLGAKGTLINFVSRYIKRNVKRYKLPATLPFSNYLFFCQQGKFTPVEVSPDDMAFLQYTGGTTGRAKGAILLHRNIIANVNQCDAWLRSFAGERDDHVMVTALPLYHILALTACCIFMAKIGGCQILIPNPRDFGAFVKTIKKSRMTMIVVVNTLANALASRKDFAEVDFSRLSIAVSGGMATQAAVAKKWKSVTGRPLVEGYGLSETSPLACVNRLDIDEFTGTIGYPVSSTDISIRNAAGEELPNGEAGEICIKGPQVMKGYWNAEEETKKAFTADGYFRSGDVGYVGEDGMVRIVDRIKDMILVSGFNVYPNEVEEVLSGHPQVMEAAVVGVPDEHSGEAVRAFIVAREGGASEEELRAWCREKLTGYKIPRQIIFRDSLPKTNVGKILRRELRDEAIKD